MTTTARNDVAPPGSRQLLAPWSHPLLGRLSSRVVMSAMTRSRAGPGRMATPAMAAYYARRAHGGVALVLTESTAVDPVGAGFPDQPHLCDPDQAASWRPVTKAVHAGGARIFAQLLHCGRISHEDYTGGARPVSSTDRRAAGINRRNGRPYAVPRRLEADELPAIYEQHRRAARLAVDAGFDGVELHLAHGYLADQFLDARVNDRHDAYGGSVENRCRFALELTERVLRDLGPDRTIVRISPSRWMDGLYDWPDLEQIVGCLVHGFESMGLRILDISCARSDYRATSGRVVRLIRPLWPHTLMAGASLSREAAQAELDSGWVDMVTYGRFLIANPDLVERWRNARELRAYDTTLLDTLD